MPKALHILGNEEDGDFGLQISDFGLIKGIGVRGAGCGLRGCRLRIGGCGVRDKAGRWEGEKL